MQKVLGDFLHFLSAVAFLNTQINHKNNTLLNLDRLEALTYFDFHLL